MVRFESLVTLDAAVLSGAVGHPALLGSSLPVAWTPGSVDFAWAVAPTRRLRDCASSHFARLAVCVARSTDPAVAATVRATMPGPSSTGPAGYAGTQAAGAKAALLRRQVWLSTLSRGRRESGTQGIQEALREGRLMELWWERMVRRSYFLWTVYCDLQGWWQYYGRVDNFPWWATKVIADPVMEAAACSLPEPLSICSHTLGIYTCWLPAMIFDMVTWPLQYVVHRAVARKDRRRETARKVAAALKGVEPISLPGAQDIRTWLDGLRRRPIA